MPLSGGRRERMMSHIQRRGEEAGVRVHGQPVRMWVRGVEGGHQGLGTLAQVLAVARVQFGALGELETDPLTGVRRPHWGVLFTRLGRGPLNGPVLLGSCEHTV